MTLQEWLNLIGAIAAAVTFFAFLWKGLNMWKEIQLKKIEAEKEVQHKKADALFELENRKATALLDLETKKAKDAFELEAKRIQATVDIAKENSTGAELLNKVMAQVEKNMQRLEKIEENDARQDRKIFTIENDYMVMLKSAHEMIFGERDKK